MVKFPNLPNPVTLAGVFADPFSDLAVLGIPDDQQFPTEAETVESAFAACVAVPVSMQAMGNGDETGVWIRVHEGVWVSGTAARYGMPGGDVWVQAEGPILYGASGGPIVTSEGELLAIVSSFSIAQAGDGRQPHIRRSLPAWLLSKIRRGDNKG